MKWANNLENNRQKTRCYYAKNKDRIKEKSLERWANNKPREFPTEQLCSTCQRLKPISEFDYLKRKFKYELQCRKCKYQKSKIRAIKLKEQGLCVSCKSPKEDLSKNYCKSCNKKYAEKSKVDRINAKRSCIEYLGGKCIKCGLKETEILDVYDFHHDSEEKEMNLGTLLARHRSMSKKVREELDKCVLYCANCHRVRHWEINNKLEGEI
jgi:hypothetical protein